MNCAAARALLPLLASGDLGPDERVAAEGHAAACAACAAELAGLRGVLALLDADPAPAACVDVAEIHRRAAAEAAWHLRRWRRLALGAGAAAAALLLVAVGRGLECRVESHQVVLRWGAPPAVPEPPAPAPVVRAPAPTPEADAKFRELSDLVTALAVDADQRDARLRSDVALLRSRLAEMRQQDLARWSALERDFRALYHAQFLARKGVEP